jgi:hypothetical protein
MTNHYNDRRSVERKGQAKVVHGKIHKQQDVGHQMVPKEKEMATNGTVMVRPREVVNLESCIGH